MTIIAVLLTAVITAIVTYKVTVAVNTPPPTTVLAATPQPKRLVIRLGKPFGAMPVRLARRISSDIVWVLSQQHPGLLVSVVDATETDSDLVVVDGDISPKDATLLSAWIHRLVYPR